MGKNQKIIFLGASYFAEEIADIVDDCGKYELTAFVESFESSEEQRKLLGYPVIGLNSLSQLVSSHHVIAAIGSTKRSEFIQIISDMGFQFATILHPTCRVSRVSSIGSGSILNVGVIVAAQTRIGQHVVINRASLIGHHTTIGDYVTISPGVNIAGRVSIGQATYIGMGAIILDGITIGSHSIIGAGAVVTKDVPSNVVVLGMPAKVVKRDISGK